MWRFTIKTKEADFTCLKIAAKVVIFFHNRNFFHIFQCKKKRLSLQFEMIYHSKEFVCWESNA